MKGSEGTGPDFGKLKNLRRKTLRWDSGGDLDSMVEQRPLFADGPLPH